MRARWADIGLRGAVVLGLAPIAGWVLLAVLFTGGPGGSDPSFLRQFLAGLLAVVVIGLPVFSPRALRGAASAVLVGAAVAGWWAAHAPQAERAWAPAASRMPWAEVDGAEVTIHDVRDFRWHSPTEFDARWYDATYDVAQIVRGWYVLTRFTEVEGVAHVMASFEFPDDQFVVFSVEIRREPGESYAAVGGAFRQYEIMYVVADERDALALRTNVYDDDTWVIPMDAGPEKTGAFFLDMVERMNALHDQPEWYNTLTSSCATNLGMHYERVNDIDLPWDHRLVMPGYSIEVVEELGLLPEGVTIDEARERYFANDRARAAGTDAISAAVRAP